MVNFKVNLRIFSDESTVQKIENASARFTDRPVASSTHQTFGSTESFQRRFEFWLLSGALHTIRAIVCYPNKLFRIKVIIGVLPLGRRTDGVTASRTLTVSTQRRGFAGITRQVWSQFSNKRRGKGVSIDDLTKTVRLIKSQIAFRI